VTTPRTSRPYTPSREASGVLERRTVGRGAVLTRIHRTLTQAATSRNRSHTLLVGPRGAGKTHVLEVALGRIKSDSLLADRVCVVSIPEDVVGFTRLEDLLAQALRDLGGEPPAREESTVARQALVTERLAGRVLILAIENLDRVMDALGLGGQRGFRSWVETSGDVLVLATTPLLFPGVQERDQPWFGAFDVLTLDDLNLDEGLQLLIHLAGEAGDDSLVDFLTSDTGRKRVEALAELTGGSPRIWVILSDCLTPARLDQLVPTVQDLLESLVPYHQQLLWELPAQAQRIVRALAEGQSATMTVSEIEAAAEISKGISTLLTRLQAARWVERINPTSGDRRRTWYRLREPLLRHHFQYRAGDSRPLTLIMTILRIAFDPHERHRQLLELPLHSLATEHVVESLRSEPRRADSAYANRNVDDLQSEARMWSHESGPWSRVEAGHIVDDLVSRARNQGAGEGAELADSVGLALHQVAETSNGRTGQILSLVAVCWNGREAPAKTRDQLDMLAKALDPADPFRLLAREEKAFWTGEAGDPATARDLSATLIADYTRVLGPDHPDTLTTRHSHAHWTGEAGDPATARDLSATLIADYTRVLGPDHPVVVTSRCYWVVTLSGLDVARALEEALDLFEGFGQLMPDLTRQVLQYTALRALLSDSGSTDPTIELLRAARNGDADALTRLPPELRGVVDRLED